MKMFKKIPFVMMALLLMTVACEKEELLDPQLTGPNYSNSALKATMADPDIKTLWAGQNLPVGEVRVWDEGDNIIVKYVIDHPDWCLTETHLQVATSLAEIPQKNGNPIPGQFDFKTEHDCVTDYTYEVNYTGKWTCGNDVVIAAHAVVKNQTTCSDPVILLATENNHPAAGDEEMEARIWSITSTGSSGMLSSATAPVRGDNTDNFNGNAFNSLNNLFYFTDFGKYGKLYNQGPSPLYFNDLAGTQDCAGELEGGAACGAFYNGKYYYIGTRTDDLWEVSFKEDGTILDQELLADIFKNSTNPNKVLAFGDIDIRDEGGKPIVYGSATELPGGVVFFRMNLDGTDYTVITTGNMYGAGGTQISFGSDGVLYGVNARDPYELFSIDPGTGSTSYIQKLDVALSDLASGPVCEPEEETAWGGADLFLGKNWATYFMYEITCCNEWIVYGSNLNGGTEAYDDAIYAIDLYNKIPRTLVYDPTPIASNQNYPNGNAYDPVNDRIYFGTDDGRLFYHEIGSGTHVQVGSGFGTMACGAWYDGKYYYVQNGTNRLYKVTIVDDEATRSLIGTVPTTYGYGDIVFDPHNLGVFIGSAGSTAVWYVYDTNSTISTILSRDGGIAKHLQLAYGSNGQLYGVEALSGQFYEIEYDATTVTLTEYWNSGSPFTDLASGPQCK